MTPTRCLRPRAPGQRRDTQSACRAHFYFTDRGRHNFVRTQHHRATARARPERLDTHLDSCRAHLFQAEEFEMITTHDGRQVAICDGCDAVRVITGRASVALSLRRWRWTTNEAGEGWQHFCARLRHRVWRPARCAARRPRGRAQ